MSEGHWMCGVCDEVMYKRTPSIICKPCKSYVHLPPHKPNCSGLSNREAYKKQETFKCSRCIKGEATQTKTDPAAQSPDVADDAANTGTNSTAQIADDDAAGTVTSNAARTVADNAAKTVADDTAGTVAADVVGTVAADAVGTVAADAAGTVATDADLIVTADAAGTVAADAAGTAETAADDATRTVADHHSAQTVADKAAGTITADAAETVTADAAETTGTITADAAETVTADAAGTSGTITADAAKTVTADATGTTGTVADDATQTVADHPAQTVADKESLAVTDDPAQTFYLKSEKGNIFMGQLVPHAGEDIPEGHGKFVIKLVFLREAISWGYDATRQTVGCCITWPMNAVRRRIPRVVPSGLSASSSVSSDVSKRVEKDIVENQQETSDPDTYVLMDVQDIFEAKLVTTLPGDTCHNQVIPDGSAKYEITKVILRTWEHFEPDYHSVGAYIVWKKANVRRKNEINFYEDDGEGIMGDHAKTYRELGLKHGSKRIKNPINHERAKCKRQKIDEKKNSFVELNDACVCKKLKCYSKTDKLSDEVRKQFRYEYYDLDVNRRRDMILKYVVKSLKGRCTTYEADSRRDYTLTYFIGETQVCKNMFLATLGISEQIVRTAFAKCGDRVTATCEADKRGGNRKRKINEREIIKEHIRMFPTKDSHYCRKQTNKRYLHERLSVSKMYKLYVKWCQENGHYPQHQSMYNEVFQSEFSLSFFKRKKDKCSRCNALEGRISSKSKLRIIFREEEQLAELTLDDLRDYNVSEKELFFNDDKPIEIEKGTEVDHVKGVIQKWKEKKMLGELNMTETTLTEENEADLEEMTEGDAVIHLRKHLFNVVISRKMKNNSKELCQQDRNVNSYCCFDLQQVMECPYTNIGDAFYKRQISCYNFVVNDEADKTGYCFFWSEVEGNRGANEIATNLIAYAKRKAAKGTKVIMAFCDGCGGQNRNRIMAAACDYIITNTGIELIFICYLEKGHTENSADTVHSIIESEKLSNVQLPSEWPIIFRQISTKEISLNVTEVKHTDFLDLKTWMSSFPNWYKDAEGATIINWMTVKFVQFMKSYPHTMFFKNDYRDRAFKTIDLLQIGGKRKRHVKRKSENSIPEVRAAYNERLPISKAKYDDLMAMCDGGIIEIQHRDFYENLPYA